MLDTLCSLPLPADLFTLSIHPSEPLCAVGLASGHVHTYRLPAESLPSNASVASNSSEKSNGTSQIETAWKTRRHKGSCRALGYSYDGQQLFSAGTDGVIKGAKSETGQVEWKVTLPEDPATHKPDAPSLLHALTPQTLLLATDSSALHLFDLRIATKATPANIAARPSSTYHPHDDYISSLTPLPPSETSTSGLPKQWLSTGGTTLAITDLRRGVLVRSEDQEEELLSSCLVTGLGSRGTSTGSKAIVGGADGVLTLWERGVWDDQDERITVDRGPGGGDSLDCMAAVPEELDLGKTVAVGLAAGLVRFVKIGANQVIGECSHDEVEGVVSLGFDVAGRMISGGGQIVKVWGEKTADSGEYEDEEETAVNVPTKRAGSDSDDSDEDGEDDSDSEGERNPKRKRKKRKRNKGKHLNGKTASFTFGGLD